LFGFSLPRQRREKGEPSAFADQIRGQPELGVRVKLANTYSGVAGVELNGIGQV